MYVGINIYFKKSMRQKTSRRCNGQNDAPPIIIFSLLCSLFVVLQKPFNSLLWQPACEAIILITPCLLSSTTIYSTGVRYHYPVKPWIHPANPPLPVLATPQPHLCCLRWRWRPNKAPMSCLFPRRQRTMEEVQIRHVNLARFCQTRILCQRMSKLQLLVQSNPKWRKKNSWSSLESLKHLSLVSKLKKKQTL